MTAEPESRRLEAQAVNDFLPILAFSCSRARTFSLAYSRASSSELPIRFRHGHEADKVGLSCTLDVGQARRQQQVSRRIARRLRAAAKHPGHTERVKGAALHTHTYIHTDIHARIYTHMHVVMSADGERERDRAPDERLMLRGRD